MFNRSMCNEVKGEIKAYFRIAQAFGYRVGVFYENNVIQLTALLIEKIIIGLFRRLVFSLQ